MKRIIVLLLAVLFSCQVFANKAYYLVTCTPGEKIYELYGHSALLVVDDQTMSTVYNYGIFSFSEKNFILKFMLGRTYYLLDDEDFYDFFDSRKTDTYIAHLNLTDSEAEVLDSLLRDNLKVENRRYLYNYFMDNCATRIRDLVEKSVDGKLVYPDVKPTTYRNSVKEYVGDNWQMFGIDLLLGAPADTLISLHEQMFLPLVMDKAFLGAQIEKNGEKRLLVVEKPRCLPFGKAGGLKHESFSPTMAFALLLIVAVLLTVIGVIRNKKYRFFDVFLFSLCGLAGAILCFISFFSIHPTVFPNYLVLMLHPFHLIAIPFLYASRRFFSIYLVANLAALTLMLVIGFCGIQNYDAPVCLLTAVFFARVPVLLKK